MLQNIRKKRLILLLAAILLVCLLPVNALAAFVPCADCVTGTELASGSMDHQFTVANGGAPWSLCSCGTLTIGGGTVETPNNTNTLSQSRFPAAILSHIERIVFTEPVTARTSIHDLFHGLTNVTAIENIHLLDTSTVTNMRRVFFNTHSLTGPLDLSMWQTPMVTNMYAMFRDSGINSLNLGGSFGTGGLVQNYGSMFWGANSLTTIGDISNWNTGSAARMSRMFQGASSLTGPLDLGSWDTSGVTLMYNMFHNASSLTNLPVSSWNVERVTRMDVMFSGASGLTNLDLSGWKTYNLSRMDNLFTNASGLVSLNLSNFYTANVVNRNNALAGLSALRVLTLGPDWHWTAFNGTGLLNPPDTDAYKGVWQRVDGGTVTAPRGPTATASALLDNSLFPDDIAGIWVWAPRVSLPLARQTYLIGTPNGLIHPRAPMTRGEAATLFFRLITDEMRGDYWTQENPFPDVALDDWFNNPVSTIVSAGILSGLPDGSFAPNQAITWAELEAAITRFLDVNGWTPESDDFRDAFSPDHPITRAEAAAIVNRIFGRLQEYPEDLLPDMRTWPDNTDAGIWYYLYIQSATNAYTFQWKSGGNFEQWISLIEPRSWAALERPDSRPEDIFFLKHSRESAI